MEQIPMYRKIIACAHCEYETLNPILARNHNRSIHLQEKIYYCNICGLKYFYRHHVRQHIKGRHKNTNAKVMLINCTQCQGNVEHDECLANQQSRKWTQEDVMGGNITSQNTGKAKYSCSECKYTSNQDNVC